MSSDRNSCKNYKYMLNLHIRVLIKFGTKIIRFYTNGKYYINTLYEVFYLNTYIITFIINTVRNNRPIYL